MKQRFAVYNCGKNTMLAARAERASTFWARAKGLIGRSEIEPGSGLIIRPCNSVHMCGMRFAIDVLYVSGDDIVLASLPGLRPWSFGPLIRNAGWVLELPTGVIAASGTTPGDRLAVRVSAEQA